MTNSNTKDAVIIEGSIWAAIWHMSWPIVLDFGAIALASLFDAWIAGRIGASAQAAIGVGAQIMYLLIILTNALPMGTSALVSRFWGAGDKQGAKEAARHSIIFAFFFGAASVIFGLAICQHLLLFLGATPETAGYAWQLLKFELFSTLPFCILWMVKAVFRARGNARLPMAITFFTCSVTILTEIALCIYPLQLGMAGIGIAWLVAALLSAGLILHLLKESDLGDCLDFHYLTPQYWSFTWLKRLMNIGIPACIQDVVWVFCNFAILLILARTNDPTAGQAAWGVGLRVEELLASFPLYALARASGTIVGQNLGASRPDRASRAGWQIAAASSAWCLLVAICMFLFGKDIAGLMSNSKDVIADSVQYLQIIGLSLPFQAFAITLFGAMQGAGYTRWPMIAEVACLLFIRLPLCWYLAVELHMGSLGTWTGMALSVVLVGLLASWQFKTGAWKTQQV